MTTFHLLSIPFRTLSQKSYLSREARLSTHADSAYEMSTIAYQKMLKSDKDDAAKISPNIVFQDCWQLLQESVFDRP